MRPLKSNITYKNKMIVFVAVIGILVALLISTYATTAFAADASAEYDKLANADKMVEYAKRKEALEGTCSVGSLLAVAWDMDCVVNGTHPEMSFSKAASSVTSIKSFNFDYEVGGKTVNINIPTLVSGAYNTLLPVGMALMVLYFLIEVLNDVQLDNFTLEKFVKRLLILSIGILVLMNGAKIFNTVIEFGDELSVDIRNSLMYTGGTDTTSKETWVDLYNAGSKGGVFSSLTAIGYALGYMLKNLITWLLMWIAIVFIYFIAYSRLLELTARFVLAPIGCASLVSSAQQGAAHSPGMRYIRKFASVCLQGAVLVAGVGAAGILQSLVAGMGGGNSVIGAILIPIALIGFSTKSQHISDDVVGV